MDIKRKKQKRTLWVKKEFFDLIVSGEKTLEVRVLFPSLESIQKGDLITLNNQATVKAKDIRIYSDFERMLTYENPSQIWPRHNKEQVLKVLKRLYPTEKEKLGVVVFEMEITI